MIDHCNQGCPSFQALEGNIYTLTDSFTQPKMKSRHDPAPARTVRLETWATFTLVLAAFPIRRLGYHGGQPSLFRKFRPISFFALSPLLSLSLH